MAEKRGKRSGRAPKAATARNLPVDTLVVFGILVSICLIGVSVALNVRMGFRSADGELDGKLYGAGAGLGDCLKAVAPFMLSWGIRHGDVLAALSAGALFAVCTGYSFVSALGFAAEQRAGKASMAQGEIDTYQDLRAERARLEERLRFLGEQRTGREVQQAIEAVFSRPAWNGGQTVRAVSEACTLNRKATRSACEEVATLQEEKARADEADAVRAKLEGVAVRLQLRDGISAGRSSDAQLEALADLAAMLTDVVTKEHVGLGLSLMMALFLELGSGLGLYMVTTPWRTRAQAAGEAVTGNASKQKRLGHVDGFMLACVEPGEGAVSIETVHAHYVRWCGEAGFVPYGAGEFAKRFVVLAAEVGLECTTRGGLPLYRNVRLVGVKGAWRSKR